MDVTTSGDLLKMLMPAVSPVPASRAPQADSKLPIESRSFDSLLAEARQSGEVLQGEAAPANEAAPTAEPDAPINPLPGLTGISSIHNASLRQIIAGDTRTVVTIKRLYWRRSSNGELKIIAEDNG